jgi:hypothetical protein
MIHRGGLSPNYGKTSSENARNLLGENKYKKITAPGASLSAVFTLN